MHRHLLKGSNRAYFQVPWPPNHTFAMWKFDDLASVLVEDGVVRTWADFVGVSSDDLLTDAQFLRCHGQEYYTGFVEDTLPPTLSRRIGFTQRPDHGELVSRTKLECAATLKAARLALSHGLCVSTGGGTHHAHRHWGSGFTVLNDLALAATLLKDEHSATTRREATAEEAVSAVPAVPAATGGADARQSRKTGANGEIKRRQGGGAADEARSNTAAVDVAARASPLSSVGLPASPSLPVAPPTKSPGTFRVLIVDLDVHQGDGTAEILSHDPDLFTFSMHCQDNFPLGFFQEHLGNDESDLDVGLAAGTGDSGFLAALAAHLPSLLDTFRPDIVLYDAGVDPFEGDRLGKLCLTEKGLFDRDAFVFETCLGRGVPCAAVIGGGYDRDRKALARRHSIVHRAAAHVWVEKRHLL